jgi:hypothetical protein
MYRVERLAEFWRIDVFAEIPVPTPARPGSGSKGFHVAVSDGIAAAGGVSAP